jgi:hypothetical protein
VPQTILKGETADISAIALLCWYEWVMFQNTLIKFPEDNVVLGRDLGPAINIGPAMARKILKENGQTVIRSTVRSLTPDKLKSEDHKAKQKDFDVKVHEALGDAFRVKDFKDDPDLSDIEMPTYESYEDDDDGAYDPVSDIEDTDPNTHDHYVGTEVNLSIGDKVMSGKVQQCKREADGSLKGTVYPNPILDSCTYEVEFPDGQVVEYSANIIAENMYTQCNTEGNQYLLLDEIIDWQKDESQAIKLENKFVHSHNGNQHYRKMTKGWKLCIKWKDGTTSWERLADLKESYPIEVAKFAISRDIHDEAAFAWWVPYVLVKCNRIISTVNRCYQKHAHKYGIEIPNSFDNCVRLDQENGNTLWQDTIRQEMSKVRIAFRTLDDDEAIPLTYQEI